MKYTKRGTPRPCLVCGNKRAENKRIFCSNRCQRNQELVEWISLWLSGTVSGTKKDGASSFIKRYLIERDGNQCSECCWAMINVITGKVPIELDHIDGDASNNAPWNVRLLCPNCHSLTPTFRALNKNSSRKFRIERA